MRLFTALCRVSAHINRTALSRGRVVLSLLFHGPPPCLSLPASPHAPLRFLPQAQMASHTLSSHAPLWEARAAYPDRQGPRELAGWRADSAGAAVAAPDPVLSSLCPGSAPRIERTSEMGALVPRAALRTAHQKSWQHHSTHLIRPTRLLSSRHSRRARAPDHAYPAPSARPSDSVRNRPTGELAGASAQAQN